MCSTSRALVVFHSIEWIPRPQHTIYYVNYIRARYFEFDSTIQRADLPSAKCGLRKFADLIEWIASVGQIENQAIHQSVVDLMAAMGNAICLVDFTKVFVEVNGTVHSCGIGSRTYLFPIAVGLCWFVVLNEFIVHELQRKR